MPTRSTKRRPGTTKTFARLTLLGGNVDDYLPVLESETLVVSAVNGQVVSLSHKSTYDMLTIVSTPVTFTETALYDHDGVRDAHNIVINEDTGFAYILGSKTCNEG